MAPVASKNASSSDAVRVASSCSTRPTSAASSPTRAASTPLGVAEPSGACVTSTVGTTSSTVRTRVSTCGLRTRTDVRVKSRTNESTCPEAIAASSDDDQLVRHQRHLRCRWLETKTVRPWDACNSNRSRSHWIPCGSRPFAGSSRISVWHRAAPP